MKHHFLLGAMGLGVAALLAACGSANPNSMTFVGNAQTVERVFPRVRGGGQHGVLG